MSFIREKKTKSGTYFYLIEGNGNGKMSTYLGKKCRLPKARGWTNLSPEIVNWLKEGAKQKTKPVKLSPDQKGKYRAIIIDPPWPVERINRIVAGGNEIPFDYPTMTVSQIKNDRKLVPVRRLANKTGCFIFLWTTQKYLPSTYAILEAWGFKYLFTMVWEKGHGMKPYNLPLFNCEFVLCGRRGLIDFADTKDFRTIFAGARRNHSQKPEEFYTLIKRICPPPRMDIFSREKHDGFDQFGNETDRFSVTKK